MDPMRLLEYIATNYPDVYEEAVDNELLFERAQVAARLEAIDLEISRGRPGGPEGPPLTTPSQQL